MNTSRTSQVLALIACLSVLIVLGVSWINWAIPGARMQRIAKSLVGQPEGEVLQALGVPKHVVYAGDLKGQSVNSPWEKMNFVPVPTRPVRNKVLLYSEMSWAVYIYIDEQGVVEYVATAAT